MLKIVKARETKKKSKTTRKIHTKLHPGLEWRIFHILTSEDIDDFTATKFVS